MIGDRPAHDFAAPGVDDRAAVNPPVACPVLGDVGEPDPIGAISSEPALREIVVGCRVRAMPALTAMLDIVDTGPSHEACHAFAADLKPQAHPQLGMDPGSTVGAT